MVQGLYEEGILREVAARGIEKGNPVGNNVRHNSIARFAYHDVRRAHEILIMRLCLGENEDIFFPFRSRPSGDEKELLQAFYLLPGHPSQTKTAETYEDDNRGHRKT